MFYEITDDQDDNDDLVGKKDDTDINDDDIKLSPDELLSKSIENYKLYLENEKEPTDTNDVNQKIKELEDKLLQLNEKQ